MENPRRQQTFRFRRPRGPRGPLIAIGIVLALFTALWFWVPDDTLFWIMVGVLAVLVWVASYGWRGAVEALIELLYWLDER